MSLMRLGWSDRKISRAMGLHRSTIARYRRGIQNICISDSDWKGVLASKYFKDYVPEDNRQSVPLSERQVPTDTVKNPLSSKSRAKIYHAIIQAKLTLGQSARSIYQDLVQEKEYAAVMTVLSAISANSAKVFLNFMPVSKRHP
jgi:IS30 family transposase